MTECQSFCRADRNGPLRKKLAYSEVHEFRILQLFFSTDQNFFDQSPKADEIGNFCAPKKKLTEKNIGRKKIRVRKNFGRTFCWSVEKKSWKIRKFRELRSKSNFFRSGPFRSARQKLWHSVIPNSILLVDLRYVNGEKCRLASPVV